MKKSIILFVCTIISCFIGYVIGQTSDSNQSSYNNQSQIPLDSIRIECTYDSYIIDNIEYTKNEVVDKMLNLYYEYGFYRGYVYAKNNLWFIEFDGNNYIINKTFQKDGSEITYDPLNPEYKLN